MVQTKKQQTCYMCAAPRSSKEHVPPQAVFPEFKDVGKDVKRNLITVPSCDLHNSRKSEDDQYLQFILILHIGANHIGKKHFHTKIIRAVQNFPNTYKKFFVSHTPIFIDGQMSGGFEIDRVRLDGCIEKILRALFFSEFKTKWEVAKVVTACPTLLTSTEHTVSMDEMELKRTLLTRKFLAAEMFRGANPEVFKFRSRYDEKGTAFAVQMIYYDCFEICAYSADGLNG